MAQSNKPRAKKNPPPPLDWRALASGAALRGLTEVLATPAERRSPEPQEEPPTVAISTSVVETPTVVESPSVGESHPVGVWVSRQGPLPPATKVLPVEAAEHAMTLGEQYFFQTLWAAPESPEIQNLPGGARSVSLGYDRLAKLVRLNEKSVRQILRGLVEKYAIEITGKEDSAARQGKTYRLLPPAEVLTRQRQAGLRFVVKRGRAVEFVWRQGETPTVG